MLLIIEALLILAALGRGQRAAGTRKIYPLDMATSSVDDQYDGCTVKMAHLVKTKYLQKEINNSVEFKNAWQEGEVNATAPEDNLTRNHSIAIYVYTNFNSNVYRNFNTAVRNGKKNYTKQAFNWYSLQFLLTDAIKVLTETQIKCKVTYRGTKAQFYQNVKGKKIRFGSFTSSSLERKVAQDFGNISCFEIKTCEGADVIKYSKYPEQKEVLIPPYEKFKVTAVKTRKRYKSLWCDTVYKLESSGKRSDLNCAVAFKKPSGCLSQKLMFNQGQSNGRFKGTLCGCQQWHQMLVNQLNPAEVDGLKRCCCCRV
ncbi:NAD(P)(+)--arginine ADP-ribosyltransferase 2-like [Puntigrus tetrazona]|uniref:NAD(P)(+)--arginine ADP-ribosyltransferase 2-like n=1 Tax=Puntigrus tetrazona TaxID=1606681 RepID=UPI001C88FCDD|nr:NAD(P)(+)--arginine ADP-ribosyltransferase 2-like [Puntigrus tetrazona]XP_043090200.1 NAD(P)(+)--arginine ADP-ribosyltransferase 2-like [Puntigrus tetrazona]